MAKSTPATTSYRVGTVLLLLATLSARAADPHGTSGEQGTSRITPVVQAVQTVMPTVVNISTERVVRVSDPFDQFFNEFFAGHFRYFKESMPLGSGVIVDAAGLIVTNYHVIKRASQIIIRFWDGTTGTALLVAYDATNDLALLQLVPADGKEPRPLQAVPFSIPDDLHLGETVVTVGNPFGLEHSVAAGVLSARNRTLSEGNVAFNDILQTDAAINPGNSGGPLVNLDGELIGINLAIRRDAEGIGFAIPLRRIEDVLARWLVPSRFSLGFCGLVPKTLVTDGAITAVVDSVVPDGPAVKAGVQAGDTITRVNGTAVSRAIDVSRVLWRLKPEEKVILSLAGKGDKAFAIGTMGPEALARVRLRVGLQPLTATLNRALSLPDSLRGLAISEVLPDSDLATAEARRGDIVIRIGDVDTASLADVFTALKDQRPGLAVPVYLVAVENIRGKVFLRRYGINVTLN